MDERKRDSMIAYLRHRMEEFGIKPEDLAAVLASEPLAQKARRSMRPATSIKPGADRAAITPGTVTISPAVPGDTSRSAATRGSTPTGRNSVVTNAKAPTATAPTASHERTDDEMPSSDTAPFAGRLSSINIVLFASYSTTGGIGAAAPH